MRGALSKNHGNTRIGRVGVARRHAPTVAAYGGRYTEHCSCVCLERLGAGTSALSAPVPDSALRPSMDSPGNCKKGNGSFVERR